MAESKDVELTEVQRSVTLKEAGEAKREMQAVLNRLMGSPATLEKLKDEFSDECREARAAQRALQKAERPETRRLIEKEKRKSACEKQTSSTPLDWFFFLVMGVCLHAVTAGLFAGGLGLFMETRDDDGTLWVWFSLELFFASLLVYGIIQANKARKLREENKDKEVV